MPVEALRSCDLWHRQPGKARPINLVRQRRQRMIRRAADAAPARCARDKKRRPERYGIRSFDAPRRRQVASRWLARGATPGAQPGAQTLRASLSPYFFFAAVFFAGAFFAAAFFAGAFFAAALAILILRLS